MVYKNLILEEGDEVWAYRPIYNGSDELYPVDKQIRPYIVLKTYDDVFLASPVTSNSSHSYNYDLANGSYVAVNDLYIIKNINIIRRIRSFDKKIIDDLYHCCYKSIRGNHSIFKDVTKQAFLEAYKERFKKQTPVKKIKYYNIGDIIFLDDYPKRKYIVDEVCDDKYYTYHVTKEEPNDVSNYEFDFSARIMLEKEKCYRFVSHLSKSKYLRIKKRSLRNIRQEILNRKNRINTNIPNAYTGSIIEFNDKEYFVIFNTLQNKYHCILYNGNYQFDEIRVFNKNEVKYVKILSNDEVLSILEMVRKNISILGDEKVQNKIYMRILELK